MVVFHQCLCHCAPLSVAIVQVCVAKDVGDSDSVVNVFVILLIE